MAVPYREGRAAFAFRKEVVVHTVSGQKEQTTSELGDKPTSVDVMWERFLELERSWQGRLANQAQVIENLSQDNRRLRGVVGAAEDVVHDLNELGGILEGTTLGSREAHNYQRILDRLSAALAKLEG